MPEIDIKQAWVSLGNGMVVESDVLDVARRVTEYDPNLKVQFLDDVARDVSEPPYRIVERCADGIERTAFTVWTLDETVLHRIFSIDNQKWNVLGVLDKNNARAKHNEKQRYRDKMEEGKEIVSTVLRSPRSTYTVPEDVVLGERGSPDKKVVFRDTPGEYGTTGRQTKG